MSFEPFAKIARLNRDIVITEKIDGTNGQILIEEIGEERAGEVPVGDELAVIGRYGVKAGSRNRWLTAADKGDNFGFAAWVRANAPALVQVLGPGRHFGEWWGQGIQRRYGLTEKRFSLFNPSRWGFLADPVVRAARPEIPAQLGVVPTLYEGPWFGRAEAFGDGVIGAHTSGDYYAPILALNVLDQYGSYAAPGFRDPEGIVVFHSASSQLFKATIKGDEKPKGQA